MSKVINVQKTPSFVYYIISTHILYMALVALPMVIDSTSAGTALANKLITNATVLFGNIGLSAVEVFLLRRNFGKFTFFSSMILETGKLWTTAQLLPVVSASDHQLLLALSGASFFSVFVSKIFSQKIKNFSQSPLSNNITQVLPALAIMALFAGSTIAGTLGLGPVSQQQNPKPFNVSNIDVSMFQRPSWNAEYYLDNVLDMFGGGMNSPFMPILNVTNNNPDPNALTNKLTPYLKDTTYLTYSFDAQKATSGTFFPASTGTTTPSSYSSGTTFSGQTESQPIPSSYFNDMSNSYSNRSYNVHDITISYDTNNTAILSNLPAVRSAGTYGYNSYGNNFYGSFIDPNTVSVYTADGGNQIGNCGSNTGGITGCTFNENDVQISNLQGVSDVGLTINGLPSAQSTIRLNYQQNYVDPSYDQLNAYSLGISNYTQVFSPAQWNAIKTFYLQVPTGSQLPNATTTSYRQWSPLSYQIASEYNSSTASVMQIINALSNAMSPNIDFTQGSTQIYVPGGNLGLKFNVKLWLYPQAYTLQQQTPPHPDPTQDYVQWFLSNANNTNFDGGVFVHFAAAMTMMLREMGIPARFVTGYAYGNTSSSATNQADTTVYQALHRIAWTEALVPLQTPAGLYYEWVTVDTIGPVIQPILSALAGTPLSGQKYDLLDPYSYNSKLVLKSPAGKQNFGESIFRVGVDQKNNVTGLYNNIYDPQGSDTGVLYFSNFYYVNSTYGEVHVGVFVAKLNFFGYSLNYLTGAGSVPVTFKLVSMANPNSYTIRHWNNQTDTVTVYSNPVTSIAQVTFDYIYLNNQTNQAINGGGQLNFMANITDPNSKAIINGIPNPLGLGGSRTAISDTNRSMVSLQNYNPNDPTQDVFDYDSFNPFSKFNGTIDPRITYSPLEFSTTPLLNLASLKSTQVNVNSQQITSLSYTDRIVYSSNKPLAIQNISMVKKSTSNYNYLFLFGLFVAIPISIKYFKGRTNKSL